MLSNKYLKQYKEKLPVDLYRLFNKIKNSKDLDFTYLIETSAVYSSNIEGNPMDINSFMNTKEYKEKTKPKAYVEIMELVNAYNFAMKRKLTEKNLLEAHKILSNSFLAANRRGKYRQESVGVYGASGLVYLAIEPEKVAGAMKEFFTEIIDLLDKKLDIAGIFYYAAMIHLKFAHIHPFTDGNGRAARLLEKWFLTAHLGKQTWLIQSEQYYKEHVSFYYRNINLGVNYYESDYDKCLPFLLMLPKSL